MMTVETLDTIGRLSNVKEPGGDGVATTRYGYAGGLLASVTDALGTTSFEYGSGGVLSKISRGNRYLALSHAGSDSTTLKRSVTNALGETLLRSEYTPATGAVVEKPWGLASREIASTPSFAGDEVVYAISGQDLEQTVTFKDGVLKSMESEVNGVTHSFEAELNSFGEWTKVNGTSGGNAIEATFSSAGLLTGVELNSAPIAGYTTTFPGGGKTQISGTVNGQPSNLTYSARGEFLNNLETYGEVDEKWSQLDSNLGRTMTTASGKETLSYYPSGDLGGREFLDGSAESFKYDALGNLKEKQNANGIFRYELNEFGETTGVSGEANESMTPDRAGQVSVAKDETGAHFYTHEYGMPKTETHIGGVLDGATIDWTYDGQGRLLGVRVSGESQYGFSYGEWRHPEGVATKGKVSGTWSEFDAGSGRPKKLELGRLTVQTEYDDQGRLTLRKNFVAKGGQPPEEVTRTMPVYTGKNCTGVGTLKGTWLVDYNTTGALSGATRSATGHAFSYATGESGRDLGIGGYVDDRPPRKLNEAKVNVLGSVTPGAAVTIEGIAASVSGAGEFNKAYPGLPPGWHGFDVVATKTTLGVTAVSEETVQAFVPPASEELSYDGNGNLSEDARYEYRWNAKNQLIESEEKSAPSGEAPKKAEYKYDGNGRRVEKTIHAGSGIESRTTFLWEGWHVVREIRYDKDNNEVLRRDYTWGPDVSGTHGGAGGIGGLLEIVEKKGANTTTNLVLNDGLGNVVGLVDADTGKVVALYEYGPFGEELGSTGERADSCPFRYQTKYLDETGLYYWGLRHYVPRTRTWASRDPLREGGGPNMYAYCNNRPLEYCDPLGGGALLAIYRLGKS